MPLYRGLLPDEEEFLFKLRQEKEGEAFRILEEDRIALEEESRRSQVGMWSGSGRQDMAWTEALIPPCII